MEEPQETRSGFLDQLKRRHVVRVGLTYAGAAFVLLQGAQLVLDALNAPEDVFRLLVLCVLAGFPLALLLGWLFDLTPEGLRLTLPSGALGPVIARFPPRVLLGGLAALLLAGTASAVALNLPRAASAEVPAGADLIAVLPFTTTGQDMEVLEEGMVDLLARNLDQVGGIRTVDPRTVLYRWEQRAGQGPLKLGDALAIAREAAAGSVLTGSVVALPSQQVRILADLHAVDGTRLAAVEVDGSTTDLLGLVDSLSIKLVRELWRSTQPIPRLNVSAITSGNLDAIRAYLVGERHYRASAWDSAMAAFQRAVAEDSLFPLAHYRLAATANWTGQNATARRHSEIARRLAERLPEREQALVRAEELRSTGRRAAAIDSMSAYVERYPDDPEGWYFLADDLYHLRGDDAAAPGARTGQEVAWMFEKALALDPSFAPALIHPLEIAFETGDEARMRRHVALLERAPTLDSTAVRIYRDALAVVTSPPAPAAVVALLDRIADARDGVMDLGRQAVKAVYYPVLRSVTFWPAAEREEVLTGLRERGEAGNGGERAAAVELLVAGGRVEEARALLSDAEAQRHFGRGRGALMLLPVLAGYAPPTLPPELALAPHDQVAAELVTAIDRSDIAAITGAVERARQLPPADTARSEMLARAGAGFARVARGDTVAGLREVERALEPVPFAVGSAAEALWYRWLERMAAHPATRLRVQQQLERTWPGHPVYEVQRQFLLAGVLEAEGRSEEAREAASRFLAALSGADADLPVQQRIRLARRAAGTPPAG